MRPAGWWCALFLVLVPVSLLTALVYWLGVNTLIADEFTYVEFIRLVREDGPWTSWLLAQHNEHRVVPMKLVMALLQGPTRWSQSAEMYVSAVLSAATVLVFWRIYRAAGGTTTADGLFEFAPIAWLLSSLSQYENQFFGMMMCHYFTALGTAAALWLLAARRAVATVFALLAAWIGAFSIGNGFLAFPAGILILAAQRASWQRWAIWCGGGVVAAGRYAWDYVTPPHTRPLEASLSTVLEIVTLWLTTLGAPVAAGSVYWGGAAGLALLAVAGVIVARSLRGWPARAALRAPGTALTAFGLASAAMVAVGRVAMHGDPLGSRYITYTNFAWIGVYLLILQHARFTGDARWRFAAWTLLVPALLAANLHGLHAARQWRRERLLDQYVLQTFYQQPDSVLGRLGPPAIVRSKAEYLRAQGLSAFAVPQQLQFLTSGENSIASAEILEGRAIVQRLRCPVESLSDIAVLVLPAGRPDGAFSVTVQSGSRRLASRTLPTSSIKESGWLRVPLDAPYTGCRGIDLTVRIESQNTEAGTGVAVLAAPPTYDGALYQADAPIAGRRLALALNAARFGLLR